MAGDDVGFAQNADSSMTGWLKSMGHQYPVNKAVSLKDGSSRRASAFANHLLYFVESPKGINLVGNGAVLHLPE